jgi:2,3-dimethylmalate lyase
MSQRLRYRELLASDDILVGAGIYDAFSARLAEEAGFKCVVAGGNAGIGGLLAAPDMGQTNMRDMADLYARICAAVDLPVTVDADTGYGGIHNVRQAVRAFENAGVSALTINDQTFPNRCGYLSGKAVIPVEEMLAKIKAAVDTRRDGNMVIVARTDAANVVGLDEALDRCELFLEAGADIAKPQCVDDATISMAAGRIALDIRDLQALGAASVSLPSLGIFAAMQGMRTAFAAVRGENSLASTLPQLPSLDDYYSVVGLSAYTDLDNQYAAFATRIIDGKTARGRG